MERRNFLQTAGAAGLGSVFPSPGPGSMGWFATSDELITSAAPTPLLVAHCKRILEQNLLKAGETVVVATPMIFDCEYLQALLVAASELGATGLHAAVISLPEGRARAGATGRLAAPRGYALTPVHWNLYAQADLLITSSLGSPPGLPSAATSYNVKVGSHEYRSDHEYINRPGSKTRWLQLGYDLGRQQRYFPTEDRRERTIKGARLLDETRGELRVTSAAGTDWRCSMAGRPGHAQYGIADVPGRWDNFGYGCVACGPVENSATGVLVLQNGDIIPDLYPPVLEEQIKLTFSNGYVTKIEGGRRARQFEALLASYGDKESYGTSHFGWGTHEQTELRGAEDVGHYHHNRIGSLLYALGMNYAHGLGGKEVGYSGLGMTQRRAPNHTHFTMFDCDVSVAGRKAIERGRVSPDAGGIA
jgi:hypothetical protein